MVQCCGANNPIVHESDRGPELFVKHTAEALRRVEATFCTRGLEYGDTWGECRFVAMRAVAGKLGANVPDDAWRALAAAAFVDMKYQRLQGGYKDDTIIDGMAYSGYLAQEVEAVIKARVQQTGLTGPTVPIKN